MLVEGDEGLAQGHLVLVLRQRRQDVLERRILWLHAGSDSILNFGRLLDDVSGNGQDRLGSVIELWGGRRGRV